MEKAGLLDQVPPEVWKKEWNVNCQAVGDAEGSIKYLAPYVFRVAISDSRIVKVENDKVFVSYKKQKSNRLRTLELGAMEFIRRFLQHVLPTGFMKVRYYGFLSPSSKVTIEEVRARIELAYGFTVTTPEKVTEQLPPMACKKCGKTLRYVFYTLPTRQLREPPS
jgi:hypothetical protein